MEDIIHLHFQKEKSVFSLLLFIIPIIIFVGFLVFVNLESDRSKQQAATIETGSVVLGDKAENIK